MLRRRTGAPLCTQPAATARPQPLGRAAAAAAHGHCIAQPLPTPTATASRRRCRRTPRRARSSDARSFLHVLATVPCRPVPVRGTNSVRPRRPPLLAAALRQALAGYEQPPGFIGSAPAGLHIRGQKIGNPEMHFSRDELIGSAFIAFGITLFVCFFYVAIVSKLLPPYENQFLAAIQEDWYYCLLVPLTLPVIIVAVYLHWLSMKMFKHA